MDFQQEISGYLHKTASIESAERLGRCDTRKLTADRLPELPDAADHYFAIALLARFKKPAAMNASRRLRSLKLAELRRPNQTSR